MKFLLMIVLLGFTQPEKTIIFFGDSLTAGYGIDPSYRFTSLIENKISEKNLNYNVINAGLSGETTAGGLRRINWILKKQCDVLVLCLGGNDGLRGIDVNFTEDNLKQMIDIARQKNPKVKILLMGMESPPNMGEDYTKAFRNIFSNVAKEKKTAFIPFLLEGVGGKPELNLPDQVHPNPKGHKILAETVWTELKDLL